MNNFLNSEFIAKLKKSDIYINLSHAKNYFSADMATKAIGFISIPIFTRLLTQSEYGISSVFLSYVAIFTILFSLNCTAAVSRYYFEKTDDFKQFISTTLTLLVLIFFVTVPIYLMFYLHLGNIMNLPGALPVYIILASFFSIIYGIYFQILVVQHKSKEVAKISIAYGYSGFIISVIITFFLSSDRYLGKIWASLLIGLIFAIYFLIKLRSSLVFSIKKEHIRYIFSYSFPLIPYALSSIILAQFDRIMINNISDSASAGLYSLGYTVGLLLAIVISATLNAMIPQIMDLFDKKEFVRIDSLFKRIFSIETIVALGLILFGKELIIMLADRKFHIASEIVPIIVFGYILYGMSIIYAQYIVFTKKMIYLSLSVLSAGIINIILNWIYISQYGYVAAAYTTAISYFFMFLFNWITAKYILKQRTTPLWLLWKSIVILSIAIIIMFLFSYLNFNFVLLFLCKLLLLIVFSISLFFSESKKIYSNLIAS
ncbi:MAG TPA: oligosaccharide flippase family protein [Methanofastidiosum sp.]|nr:oligosaccharide flippase family protein [Methanofastidiosum sp.]